MGESRRKRLVAEEMHLSPSGLQTAGGRVQVRWESESAATPMGQLAYFIEFLTLTGLWSRWLENCPLSYTSPNAPSRTEVLGTWLLSILSGQRPYAHVAALRCDGVTSGLLGMSKVISEDALRRGWHDAGQGWQGQDGSLRLSGWEAARRGGVLRRPLQGGMRVVQEDDGQQLLGFIETDRKAGKRLKRTLAAIGPPQSFRLLQDNPVGIG